MTPNDRTEIALRIIVEHPVPGVLHSLQAKDDTPLDPKVSLAGEPLAFNIAVGVCFQASAGLNAVEVAVDI